MFFHFNYTSNTKISPERLSYGRPNEADFHEMAVWAVNKWGYTTVCAGDEFLDISKTEQLMRDNHDTFTVIRYGQVMVGMFSLEDIEPDEVQAVEVDSQEHADAATTARSCELSYVYIDEVLRGQGVGRYLMDTAHTVAHDQDFKHVRFNTVHPKYNAFYQRSGAVIIGEAYFDACPIDEFRMPVSPRTK